MPVATRTLRVLYLFAGHKRKADMKHYLTMYGKKNNIKVKVYEVDILRGKRYDLTSMQRKARYLNKVKMGAYDVVIASPPCGTFSRARWANRRGPRPLRLRHCPRGFPWLTGPQCQGVRLGNDLADFAGSALKAQFERKTEENEPDPQGLMEHPEDLGTVECGDHPGSIWHFYNIVELLQFDRVEWGALAQSDFGRPYPKPTRLLGRFKGFGDLVAIGEPTFDDKGKYLGPLKRNPNIQSMQVGKNSDGKFGTEATAAWPPELCKEISKRMVAHFLSADDKAQEKGLSDVQEVGDGGQELHEGVPETVHGPPEGDGRGGQVLPDDWSPPCIPPPGYDDEEEDHQGGVGVGKEGGRSRRYLRWEAIHMG